MMSLSHEFATPRLSHTPGSRRNLQGACRRSLVAQVLYTPFRRMVTGFASWTRRGPYGRAGLLRGGNAPCVGPSQKIDALVGDRHDGGVRVGADDPGHNGGVHDPEAVDPLDPQVGRDH